jgi:hypothetical protein
MADSDPEKLRSAPGGLSEAWSLLTSNTLRKTVPQLLLGVWFWGLVLGRHDFDSPTPNHPPLIFAVFAGGIFFIIVFRRVLGVLPERRPLIRKLHANALVSGYTMWLGFGLPVHRRDVREWLGWAAMASGLVAFLLLATPSALGFQ